MQSDNRSEQCSFPHAVTPQQRDGFSSEIDKWIDSRTRLLP